MSPWEQFLPEVQLDVVGCPEILAVNAIRNSAIAFCQQTYIWRATLDPVPVQAGVTEYALTPPNETRLHAALSALLDNTPLAAMRDFSLLSDSQIRLLAAPTQDGALTVTGVLVPERDSTGADDSLFAEWLEPISHGAKQRLMVIPKQPWTNPELALWHARQYQAGIAEARRRVNQGMTTATLRVQMRPF